MADLFENPMGLRGFEFVEFTAPERGILEPVFESIGFTHVARHRSKDVDLWRQGGINLIVTYEPNSPAQYYAAEHGPSACAMGFRVENAREAYELALSRGAQPVAVEAGFGSFVCRIRGIGGALIRQIDRFEEGRSIYDIDFNYLRWIPTGRPWFNVMTTSPTMLQGTHGSLGRILRAALQLRKSFFDIKEVHRLFPRDVAPDGLIAFRSMRKSRIEGGLRIPWEYKARAFSTSPFPATTLRVGTAPRRVV